MNLLGESSAHINSASAAVCLAMDAHFGFAGDEKSSEAPLNLVLREVDSLGMHGVKR